MTSYLMHQDPHLFPNSHTFDPTRWLPPTPQTSNPSDPTRLYLNRYLTSFSKGPRMCLGMHLAYAELYIGLATVFRRLEFELFETGPEAVLMARDCFVPLPLKGTKGLRVKVL